jgi:hypothetical protein
MNQDQRLNVVANLEVLRAAAGLRADFHGEQTERNRASTPLYVKTGHANRCTDAVRMPLPPEHRAASDSCTPFSLVRLHHLHAAL